MAEGGGRGRRWGRRREAVPAAVAASAPTDVDLLLEHHPGMRDALLPGPGRPGARPVPLTEAMTTAAPAATAAWQHDVDVGAAPRRTPTPPGDLVVDWPGTPTADGPLVSVVVPVRDRAATLPAAIESVQAQTHATWELLVVDDGSTDDSVAVVRSYAERDPRVVSVPVEHGGVSRARNAGIARARGAYVAFLDSDNTWRPDHLRAAVGALEEHGWGMAHTVLRGVKDGETYWRAMEGDREHLLVSNHVDLNVLVVRRELLARVGGFDETLRRFVDWDLVLRLSEHTGCHLVPYLGVDYHDDHEPGGAPRISTTQPWTWMAVVASRYLEALHRHPAPARDDLVSVLLPEASVPSVLGWARAFPDGGPVELVVVGARWPRWRHLALSAIAATVPHVRFVHLAGDRGRTVSANVALAAAAGARAVLVQGDVAPDLDAVLALVAALDDEAVAVAVPVVDGVPGGPDGGGRLDEATGPVVAVRIDDVRAHGALDPLLRGVLTEADLSRRWAAAGAGATVRVAESRMSLGRPTGEPAPDRLAAASALLAERYPDRR